MSLDENDILDRSRDRQPFSNSTEWEIWAGSWCDRCQREAPFRAGLTDGGCPLIVVAVCHLRTPAEWQGEHGDYTCTEFRPPGWRDPEPQPQPEPDGMDGLFERPRRGVRMLTQAPVVEPAPPQVVTVPTTAGVL